MIIGMETSSGGGGGKAYQINISSKASNGASVYYSVSEVSQGVTSYAEAPTVAENKIDTTYNGATFDKTIQCSNNLSVRLHSTYAGTYEVPIYADVIKGGITVETDIPLTITPLGSYNGRVDFKYGVYTVIFE